MISFQHLNDHQIMVSPGLDWIGFLFIVVTITDNCLIPIDPLEGKMQKDMNN